MVAAHSASYVQHPIFGAKMPRKPNYGFERSERNKAKADKKAARLQAKVDKSASRKDEANDSGALDQPKETADDVSEHLN